MQTAPVVLVRHKTTNEARQRANEVAVFSKTELKAVARIVSLLRVAVGTAKSGLFEGEHKIADSM